MPSEPEPCVFVVDDERDIRDGIAILVQSVGLAASTFSNAMDFLAQFDPQAPGCLVIDVRLPGMNGLQLQHELSERGSITPVIMISGHGDIPMAVRAVRQGALDFIEKPFRDDALLACIQYAVELDRRRRAEYRLRRRVQGMLDSLTSREREVLEYMLAGKSNKIAARELGVSIRTVEIHRSRILHKMRAEHASDVVRMVYMVRGGDGEPV